MAATITDIGNGTGSGTGPTTTGATVTVVSTDWLVAILGLSGPETATFSDSGGNTWTSRASIYFEKSPGVSGSYLNIQTAAITSGFTNGTVSVSLGGSTGQHALQVYRVRPGAGETISFSSADTTGSGSTTTSHTAATVSVTAGRIIFGAAAIETNDPVTGDSDVTNGSWSSIITRLRDDGGDTLSATSNSQYKTVSSTGNQSWACTTTSARASARSYLVLLVNAAAKTLAAAAGSYTLTGGPDVNFRKGRKVIPDAAGSYALTGTAATFIYSGLFKTITAEAGSYSLLGIDATLTHGYKLDATTAGSYALTGSDATLRRALPMVAELGVYTLTGTDATLTKASLTNKVLGVDPGVYVLTGTDATPRIAFKLTVDSGSYVLTGSDVALVTAANKVILADPGSYALVGTDAVPTITVAPPSVSPLHIGEWPIDKKKRRRREDAVAAEQRARKRFRDAIGRLLEGLPPEFDEPEALDEALDRAVQASNLLYAMSAPIREINAVNELIDHIRQLRIAQPIAQLAMAQAYNQAHRHLKAKAQEDDVMALLLGE